MKKRKQTIAILILCVSSLVLAVSLAKTWESRRIVGIMDRYDEIDYITIFPGQTGAQETVDGGRVEQIKTICRLQTLYAAKKVEKEDSAALVELQFYAQKALVGTARLYKLADGSFMEQEKQARFCTADGFYYVLEWENRWAFPLKERDAQTLLALQAAGS